MFSLYITIGRKQHTIATPALGTLLFLANRLNISKPASVRIWDHKHACFVR